MDVAEAVASRRSVRAFTPEPVDPAVLRRVLERAQQAPSGGNLQPWHVAVLTGAALDAVRDRAQERLASGEAGAAPAYEIYPPSLWTPYRERRYANAEQLYATLGIPREDTLARITAFARNWAFFDAPVGLLLFVDREMGRPQWADLGIWLQTVMLLLRGEGLHSCAQEAWSIYHDVVAELLDVPERLMLFCGLAVGHEDPAAPVNAMRADRAPLAETVTFLDAPGPLATAV